MDTVTEIRREIERTFVPHALARGFDLDRREAPDFLRFSRCAADEVQVFDIQWDKHGRARFTLNFGGCPPGGLSFFGRHVAAKDVHAGSPGVCHGRLQPIGGRKQSWFGEGDPPIEGPLPGARLHTPAELVRLLLDLFAEVEAYWVSGAVGPHLLMMPERRPRQR
jgi:hypothetical protein